MANAGASLNLASNRPDLAPPPPEHPQSNIEIASNLTDVLRHAPILKQAPNLATTIAKNGGNVKDNAEAVAAVAHARALDLAAQRLMKAEQEYRMTGNIGAVQAAQENLQDVRGNTTLGGQIAHEVPQIPGQIQRGVHHIVSAATATQGPAGGSAGGVAPGVTTPQFTGNIQSGVASMGHAALQQLNPLTLMQTPQHLYRTWMDIYDRHGAGAMVEAMIPSLAGAGVGFFLTHGGGGTEEGATLGADLVAGTEDTTGTGEAVVSAANQAQRTGQGFRAGAKVFWKPVSLPAGAIMKAATGVGTSPTFLGANVAGIATQLEPSFRQSWVRTQNGMPKGEIGSFGRAVATGLSHLGIPGLQPGSSGYKLVSGSLDAFSNIAIPDPLGAGGRVIGQARTTGLGGPLGRFWGGTTIQDENDVDRIYQQYNSAKAFVKDAAQLNGAQLMDKYQQLAGVPLLARELGAAHTEEDVLNVLRGMARTKMLTTRVTSMPLLTDYTKMRYALGQTRLGTSITTPLPTMFDEVNGTFNPHEFTIGDPYAVPSIMHYMRLIGERESDVTRVGQLLLESSDPKLWRTTMSNVSQVALGRMVLKALGKSPVTDQILQSIKDHADEIFGGRGAGLEGFFGSSPDGTDLSRVYDTIADKSRKAGVFFTQQGKMTLPKLGTIQKTAKEIAGVVNYSSAKGLYAKGQTLRDLIDDVVNVKFFQPLALATGGWALRVSSSEVLLNALRQGPLNFSAAAIARSAAKHNLAIGVIQTDPQALADMDRLDALMQKGIQSSEIKNYAGRAAQNLTRNIVAAVRGILAGTDEALLQGIGKQRYLDAATRLVILHKGYMLPEAISAAHGLQMSGQDEVWQAETDIKHWLGEDFGSQRKVRDVPMGSEYAQLGPSQSGYWHALANHAGLISGDNILGRKAARYMLDQLEAGKSEGEAAAATQMEFYRLLQGMDPETRSIMSRDAMAHPLAVGTPHMDWSEKGTQVLLGAVKSDIGPVQRELLSDIANGTVPQTTRDFMAKYGDRNSPYFMAPDNRPIGVPGRTPMGGASTVFQRAASWLHTKYLSRIVNYLSREPTYIADFANESRLLERQVKAGEITQDQADVIAQTRAIFKSIRFIHNPQDRMKVEQTLHIVAPFWFAKNQAIRRAGRLFATNPGAFEQYLKINLAVQNIGFQANQNGQNYVVFPGSGVLGTAATGGVTAASHIPMFKGILGDSPVGSIPIGLSGSTDTLQSVVPWSGNGEAAPGSPLSLGQTLASPSLGPLGAIPTRIIGDFMSGHAKDFINNMLGPVGSTAPWWTYLAPNSAVQHFLEAGATAAGTNDLGTSGNSAVLDAISALTEQEGAQLKLTQVMPSDWSGTPGSPTVQPPAGANIANNAWDRAQLLKRAKALAVSMMLLRTFAGAVSPVSVSLTRADLKWTQEFTQYVHNAKGNYLQALDKFSKDHPNFVPSTVAQSASDSGAGWGETAKDGKWIQDHLNWVHQYPLAAQYLIPPRDNTGPFSEATHLMQMAEDLRHERTPQDFVQAILVAWGNAWLYNGVMPQFDQALKANPSASYTLHNQLNTVINNYGKRNPVWLEDYNAKTSTTTRQQSFEQLQAILKDPSVPKNTQTQHLSQLVHDYSVAYLGDKAVAGSSAARASLKVQWQTYLQQKAKDWPDVSVAISDLFLHLS